MENEDSSGYVQRTKDYQEDNPNIAVLAGKPLAVIDQEVRALVDRKKGLSYKIVPALRPLAEVGFTQAQLEALVSIPFDGAKLRGRENKVLWFMRAVRETYDQEYLATLATNSDRFVQFLNFAEDVEDFRAQFASNGDVGQVYELSFRLMHELGRERAEALIERLIGESRSWDSRIKKGIKAVYIIQELLDEAKQTGHTPEAILTFRRNDFEFDRDADEDSAKGADADSDDESDEDDEEETSGD